MGPQGTLNTHPPERVTVPLGMVPQIRPVTSAWVRTVTWIIINGSTAVFGDTDRHAEHRAIVSSTNRSIVGNQTVLLSS